MSDETNQKVEQSPQRPTAPAGGFLAGFLAAREEEEATEPRVTTEDIIAEPEPTSKEDVEAGVIATLRQIYDPEIPVNIYDMGLIYTVDVMDDWSVDVVMTLTSPHCPVAETMPGEVEMKVNATAGVNGVNLQLVWDPPWDMGKMSDEARLELGLL